MTQYPYSAILAYSILLFLINPQVDKTVWYHGVVWAKECYLEIIWWNKILDAFKKSASSFKGY